MASPRWESLVEAVAALGDVVPDGDPEGERYLLRFLAAGIRICTELDDTVTPDLGRSIEPRLTWGLDNPDTLYGYSRLDGAGTYRITGTVGSMRHLELQVNTGHQGDGDFAGWRAVSSVTGDDLQVSNGGAVEIWLAPSQPEGAANWLRLDDTASFLLVRQYFSDWERERPAELVLERVDRSLPPVPLDATTLDARMALLGQWLTVGVACWDQLARGFAAGEVADVQPFLPPDSASGLKGQAYGMGTWRCRPGEALLVELTPPRCRYWGVSLCDRWWQSIDPAHRQSSLNDSQITAQPDGVTLVIAHDDPGVAGWLDPGGHEEGTLTVRYLLPHPDDGIPPARVRSVAVAELDALLAGQPRSTSLERSDALAARHRALARRLRW